MYIYMYVCVCVCVCVCVYIYIKQRAAGGEKGTRDATHCHSGPQRP